MVVENATWERGTRGKAGGLTNPLCQTQMVRPQHFVFVQTEIPCLCLGEHGQQDIGWLFLKEDSGW